MAVTSGKQGSKLKFSSALNKDMLANKKEVEKEITKNEPDKSKAKEITPKKTSEKKEEKSSNAGIVGRPRKDPYVKRSINIPENYISYITVQAGLNFKGNVSDYIVSLIENDMKSNEKLYNAIKNNI
jgi:hypothetical protein